MKAFYATAFQTELQLLTALATAIGIAATSLVDIHFKAQNEFPLFHYPAIPASELRDGFAAWITEHTDFGTIAMLFHDSTDGLQVEDREYLGPFHNVSTPSLSEVIRGIGNSLQGLTNDAFWIAGHR